MKLYIKIVFDVQNVHQCAIPFKNPLLNRPWCASSHYINNFVDLKGFDIWIFDDLLRQSESS